MNKESDDHLIEETKKVVEGIGKMFAPFCEVILHDLRTPEHAISAIENNLSGRQIGDPTTNLALNRIIDKNFPDIIQNYPNTLPNGKRVKSTSIGIRNQEGDCIALLCMNFDTSLFTEVDIQLKQFITTSIQELSPKEQLRALTAGDLQTTIEDFARSKHSTSVELSTKDKKEIVQQLSKRGLFRLRNAVDITAHTLQVTNPTIYNYLKEGNE